MSETGTSGGKTASVGDVLGGKYKVLEVLESGSSARRYRVQEADKPGDLMLTQVSSGDLEGDKLKRALERQARAMSWIRHAGVAVPRDIFAHDGMVYAAGPLIAGLPLKQYIEEKKPALADLVRIMTELSQMLDQLHESRNPYFLGCLGPDNVVINADEQVFLVGFDLSDGLKVEYSARGEAADFTAPEKKPDARSDMWCLGKLIQKSIEWSGDAVRKAYREEPDLKALLSSMTSDTHERRVPNMSTLKTRLERLKWKDAPKPKNVGVMESHINVLTVQEKSLWSQWMDEYRTPILLGLLAFIFFVLVLTLMFPDRT